MKLIASPIHSLRSENKTLRQENAGLKAELARFQGMHKQDGPPERLATKSQSPSPQTQTRSYMQPTVASSNREKKGNDSETPDRPVKVFGEMTYKDGELVDSRPDSSTNFMKQTNSSSQKAKRSLRSPWTVAVADTWEASTTTDTGQEPEPTPAWPREGYKIACKQCDSLDCQAEENIDSLRARSRYSDDSFFTTPQSRCPVSLPIQVGLLKTALRLAQETLWSALHYHWPHVQRRLYPEGPSQVKFGRTELSCTEFGVPTCMPDPDQMCPGPRAKVITSIFRVIDLRNAVCHFNRLPNEWLDKHLQSAQDLAVALQDEARAFKIRKLRDTWQAKATATYDEIATRVGWAILPGEEVCEEMATEGEARAGSERPPKQRPNLRPWPMYIQVFFHDIRLGNETGVRVQLPYFIEQAAAQWKSLGILPGQSDNDYVYNMARAKSFVSEVPKTDKEKEEARQLTATWY